jgi:hypothetical protein
VSVRSEARGERSESTHLEELEDAVRELLVAVQRVERLDMPAGRRLVGVKA